MRHTAVERLRGGVGREDGFLLTEAIIAIGLGALIMMVLMAGLAASLKASRETKRFQQGTALGTEAVESAKSASYEGLVMVDTDISPGADPRIASISSDTTRCNPTSSLTGSRFIDPDGAGPLQCEPIVSSPTGGADSINPHRTTETVDNLSFTLWRYVTWVDESTQGGPGQDLKRIVAILEWETGTTKRSFHISGTITNVRRGLAAPEFQLLPENQGLNVMRGYQAVFAHSIRNLGVEDTYEVKMTEGAEDPDRTTWVYTYYEDTNGNALLDAGEPPLPDADSDGAPETGEIATDQQLAVLAVWQLSTGDTPGLETMKFRATSTLDPQFWKETTDRTTVTTEATPRLLHLHNEPTPPAGPTNAQAHLSMTPDLAASGELFAYSQDLDAAQRGRIVRTGGAGAAESNPHVMANWVSQVSKTTPYDGTARLTLLLPSPGNTCVPLPQDFTAYLQHKASATDSSGTLISSAAHTANAVPLETSPGSGSCPSQQVVLDITIAPTTVDTNRWIDLKITTNLETVSGYDAAGFDSQFTLPRAVAPA